MFMYFSQWKIFLSLIPLLSNLNTHDGNKHNVISHNGIILIHMMETNVVLFPINVYVFLTMENIFKFNSIVVKS